MGVMEKTAPLRKAYEVRFHGRGGQGAQTAAQVLAEAALEEGKYIQAFPQFGPERRGAPVEAFVRFSSQPIYTHSSVVFPDCVLVLEPNLLDAVDLTEGLTEGRPLIINSRKSAKALGKTLKTKAKICAFDASEIASYFLGRDLPNLVLLGAFSKLTKKVEFSSLESVVMDKFAERWGSKIAEKNVVAMRVAYNEVGVP